MGGKDPIPEIFGKGVTPMFDFFRVVTPFE